MTFVMLAGTLRQDDKPPVLATANPLIGAPSMAGLARMTGAFRAGI